MKVSIRTIGFGAVLTVLAVGPASALQQAENGLGGIKLYDTGVDVIKKYGSPTEILPVTFGGAAGGGGGGAGSRGGGGFSGGAGGGSGGAGAAQDVVDFVAPPLGNYQATLAPGYGATPPPATGGAAGAGGPAGAAGGGTTTTGTASTMFVRWIYQRGAGTSINFIINKFNRVVQIEAIGISNRAFRTAQGITLGSTFSQVMEKYKNPDGYDVGQDYFMVKFLQNSKVAFRFTRETPKSPYRCTGIVVSAGKAD